MHRGAPLQDTVVPCLLGFAQNAGKAKARPCLASDRRREHALTHVAGKGRLVARAAACMRRSRERLRQSGAGVACTCKTDLPLSRLQSRVLRRQRLCSARPAGRAAQHPPEMTATLFGSLLASTITLICENQ